MYYLRAWKGLGPYKIKLKYSHSVQLEIRSITNQMRFKDNYSMFLPQREY